MVAVLPRRLRRTRVLDLGALLRRGPRLLAGPGEVALLHVHLEAVGEVEAAAGLRGVEALRRAAAERALAAAGTGALVAASGDAVLVLAPADRLEAVLAAVREPLRLLDRAGDPLVLHPHLRAGAAHARAGATLQGLLDDASAAARSGRAGLAWADASLRAADAARLRVERLLRRALPEGLFRLHYQPVVDLRTGTVVGAEALVRLQDDDGTLVQPAQLVPVAERTGLVVDLGTWVLREACRQIAVWRPRHPSLQTVAVNVSACQVARPDFADTVLAALADWGLPGSALVLELTESVLLEAGPEAVAQLQRLGAHGVLAGVDDFGTGYASLTYLRALPVRFLKVDRSFVDGLPGSTADSAVVRAVLGLAADLGLECVAEGIETPAQLAALQHLGAVRGQGYLLARPVTPERFAALLSGSLLPGAVVRLPQARTSAR